MAPAFGGLYPNGLGRVPGQTPLCPARGGDQLQGATTRGTSGKDRASF
jgi:hypothetical protein